MAARYQADFPWDRLEATALGEGDEVSWEGLKRKGVAGPIAWSCPQLPCVGSTVFALGHSCPNSGERLGGPQRVDCLPPA